jgi:hypothetical protein
MLHVSFALVPGQRLDAVAISFQRDRATARVLTKRFIRAFELRVPDIDNFIGAYDNAIVTRLGWPSAPLTAATRSMLTRCL